MSSPKIGLQKEGERWGTKSLFLTTVLWWKKNQLTWISIRSGLDLREVKFTPLVKSLCELTKLS